MTQNLIRLLEEYSEYFQQVWCKSIKYFSLELVDKPAATSTSPALDLENKVKVISANKNARPVYQHLFQVKYLDNSLQKSGLGHERGRGTCTKTISIPDGMLNY